MRGRRQIGLLAMLLLVLPVSAAACPCVDVEVVAVDSEQRHLFATISETSRVMVTAALWEVLATEIVPNYAQWRGAWRVSFFSSADAAQAGARNAAESHVADYDRALKQLVLWPGLEERRQVVPLEIK